RAVGALGDHDDAAVELDVLAVALDAAADGGEAGALPIELGGERPGAVGRVVVVAARLHDHVVGVVGRRVGVVLAERARQRPHVAAVDVDEAVGREVEELGQVDDTVVAAGPCVDDPVGPGLDRDGVGPSLPLVGTGRLRDAAGPGIDPPAPGAVVAGGLGCGRAARQSEFDADGGGPGAGPRVPQRAGGAALPEAGLALGLEDAVRAGQDVTRVDVLRDDVVAAEPDGRGVGVRL